MKRRLNSVFALILGCLCLSISAPFALAQDETTTDSLQEAAHSSNTVVEHVRSFREGDVFTAELQTKSAWSGTDVQAQFYNDSIQIDIGNAVIPKGKQLIKVEDRLVRSVYVSAPSKDLVRARIAVQPGFSAKSLENRMKVRRSARGLVIEISGDAVAAAVPVKIKAKSAPKVVATQAKGKVVAVAQEEPANSAVDDTVPTHLVASEDPAPAQGATEAGTPAKAATAAVGETAALNLDGANANGAANASSNTAAASTKSETKDAKADLGKLPENQIPVLAESGDTKKSSGDQFYRLMATLGILAVALGATLFGLKRWQSRTPGRNQNTTIRVLTTHHIGPKKSVAIIQVAGESILVGITDQNISMLKTLALIDDEVPEMAPQRFNQSLEDFAEEEEFLPAPRRAGLLGGARTERADDFAMRGLSEIRDVVSNRLKNMRNL